MTWLNRELPKLKAYVVEQVSEYIPWADSIKELRIGGHLDRQSLIANGLSARLPGSLPSWIVTGTLVYNKVVTLKMLQSWVDDQALPHVVYLWWYLLIFPDIYPPPSMIRGLPTGKLVQLPIGECPSCGKRSFEENIKSEILSQCKFNDLTPDFLNFIFPHAQKLAQQKANLDLGYTFISLCRLYQPSTRKLLISRLSSRVGETNAFVTAWFVYWASVVGETDGNEIDIFLKDMGFYSVCEVHWLDHFKDIHDEIRRTRAYKGFLLTAKQQSLLLYLHQLIGRTGAEADWDEERRVRTRAIPEKYAFDGVRWSTEYADQLYRDKIRSVLASVKGQRKLEDLSTYISRAYEWMASGSASGFSSSLDSQQVSGILGIHLKNSELRANKRSLGERVSAQEVIEVLGKLPIQDAKPQTKLNELGKIPGRAIYGVNFYHYVLNSYCTDMIELGIHYPGIDLREGGFKEFMSIRHRQSMCSAYEVVNSYDFKGFNELHQTKHMQMVFECIIEYYQTHYSEDPNLGEMETVLRYIKDSFANQWYQDPRTGEWICCSGTLYSGVRSTTLINTLLNIAYKHGVWESFKNTYGYYPAKESLHHGDDVLAIMTDLPTSTMCNEIAMKSGLDAKEEKLLNDHGYGEYLRMMYYPDGSVWGSVARSIATLVNGNWETEATLDAIGDANAIYDQLGVCVRRGMSSQIADTLFIVMIEKFTRGYHRGLKTSPLPLNYVRTSVEDGGLGLGSFTTGLIYRNKQKYPTAKVKRRVFKFSLANTPRQMSENYITYTQAKLPDFVSIPKEKKRALLDSLLTDTLGLEIPRKAGITSLRQSTVKKLSQISRNARHMADILRKRVGVTLLSLLASTPILETERSRQRRVEKLRLILPYLKFKPGFTTQDFWLAMVGYVPEKISQGNVDHTWKGLLPNPLLSLVSDYATYVLRDPSSTAEIANSLVDELPYLHMHL